MTNLEKHLEDEMRKSLNNMIADIDVGVFAEEIENVKEALVQQYMTKVKISHQQMEQEMEILRKSLKKKETVYDYD